MISILDIPLPANLYVGDPAISSTVKNTPRRARHRLALAFEECCRVGLKSSATMLKTMALIHHGHSTRLRVQDLDLEWVQVFQYFGIWIHQNLTGWIKARLSVVRVITERHTGAGDSVLGALYVHSVHPIMDCALVHCQASTQWCAWNNPESFCVPFPLGSRMYLMTA